SDMRFLLGLRGPNDLLLTWVRSAECQGLAARSAPTPTPAPAPAPSFRDLLGGGPRRCAFGRHWQPFQLLQECANPVPRGISPRRPHRPACRPQGLLCLSLGGVDLGERL